MTLWESIIRVVCVNESAIFLENINANKNIKKNINKNISKEPKQTGTFVKVVFLSNENFEKSMTAINFYKQTISEINELVNQNCLRKLHSRRNLAYAITKKVTS